MGCGASTPAGKAKDQQASGADAPYPEDGKKLRTDASLEEVYELGGQLGEGGYSRVKLATHKQTGEQWACKIIPLPKPGKRVNEYLSDRAAIMKEIDVLLDLDHPNVVGLKEYFVWHNKVYLIMELLRGGDLLETIMAIGRYSEADARAVFVQLIAAVRYLHSQGVVHRDVKLDNLLLVTPGDISHIKIADFGFAKKSHGGGSRSSMHTVCGTPGYIAPEIIRGIMLPTGQPVPEGTEGQSEYGSPCDLWSAGIVLYMLLSGMPPFYDSSEPRMLRQIMQGKFRFSDACWDAVSPEAKDLIKKLLVVDPAQRLTTAQVLAHPWVTKAPASQAHLAKTAAHIGEVLTRRRSSQRLTLAQRIEEAVSRSASVTPTVSRSVTPAVADLQSAVRAAAALPDSPRPGSLAGGSPNGGSPQAARPLRGGGPSAGSLGQPAAATAAVGDAAAAAAGDAAAAAAPA